MKIVILDGYTLNPGDISWDGLKKLGEVVCYDRTPADKVLERIGDAQIVYTNKTHITREIIEQAPNIKFIGVLATGYNVVDVDAAKDNGIPVCNVPTYGTTAVAQFTFALILELCHHVGAHSDSVHNGDWSKSIDFCYWNFPLVELAEKTIGIIGFGRIGQATAKVAKGFGMKVLAFDAYPNDSGRELADYVTLDELFAKSDVVSLHCPLFPETLGIICKENIAKMKDGVMIINASRGPLVKEQDLCEALESGKVAGAAVDVVDSEPINADNILLKATNCIITPHIAWAPKESRIRLMNIAVDNLAQFLKGNTINNVWKKA